MRRKQTKEEYLSFIYTTDIAMEGSLEDFKLSIEKQKRPIHKITMSTYLQCAIDGQSLEIIRYLLSLEETIKDTGTPKGPHMFIADLPIIMQGAVHAAKYGKLEIFQEFLKHDFINKNIAFCNNACLNYAAREGSLAKVKILLQYKDVVEQLRESSKVESGLQPPALRWAEHNKHYRIVYELGAVIWPTGIKSMPIYSDTSLTKRYKMALEREGTYATSRREAELLLTYGLTNKRSLTTKSLYASMEPLDKSTIVKNSVALGIAQCRHIASYIGMGIEPLCITDKILEPGSIASEDSVSAAGSGASDDKRFICKPA